MKNALIVGVLLLTTGAFIDLVVDESINMNTMPDGDMHAQIMWGVIDLVVILACIFHGRQLVRVALRQPYILAFVAWATLSVFWSENPSLTARRVLGIICTTALGFLLGMRFQTKELFRLLAWALVIGMVATVVAGALFPSFGVMANLDGGAWRGVFNHKNDLGSKMGIAILVFTCLLWESRRNRMIYAALLLLAVAVIVLSRSMTSIIVTVLTLSFGIYRRMRFRPAEKVVFAALGPLVALAAVFFLQGRTDQIFALIGRDSSLTGRVPLWQLSFAAVFQRPLLGAGWDAFWPGKGGDTIRSLIGWGAPHAHNGFLEIALNIGLVGLIIFMVFNYDCFRRAARYSKMQGQPLRLWPLLFYTYTFLFFFMEAPPIDRHTIMFVLFCALSVSMTEALALEPVPQELEVENLPAGIAADSAMAQEFR